MSSPLVQAKVGPRRDDVFRNAVRAQLYRARQKVQTSHRAQTAFSIDQLMRAQS